MRWTVLALAVAFSVAATPGDRQKARGHYEKGLESVREGDVDKAAKEFLKATQDDPEWADAHFQLGQVYLSLGQWDDAEESNRRAMEADPTHEDAQWWGLWLADARGLRRAAELTDHEVVSEAAAEVKRFLDSGGDILRFDDALSLFGIDSEKRAAVIKQVLILLADSAQWDRMEGAARDWMTRATERKNDIFRYVYKIYEDRDIRIKAMEWVGVWETESPEDPLGVLSSLGALYLKDGRESDAAAIYERLLTHLKQDPDLVCYRIDEDFLQHFGGSYQPVELLERSLPRYTPAALRIGLEGILRVTGVVGLDGTLRGARIEGQGLGYGLDEAALDDVVTWRFEPSQINHVPVRQHVSVDLSFSLRR